MDPHALARLLGQAEPDVVALLNPGAGLPRALGMDLPLWLSRQLGMPLFFATGPRHVDGTALLSRLPTLEVTTLPLALSDSPARRVLRLHALPGGRSIMFYALPPLHAPAEAHARDLAGHLGTTPAVAFLPAPVGPPAALHPLLADAGFQPALPADGIWSRYLRVVGTEPRTEPGYRLQVARLQPGREGTGE
jgi:hypothetical protein